jgi:ketosteroid isomerase-like protein
MSTRDPDRWTDELAIRDLVVRFSDAVTRGDWDQFEAVFTPDAVWEESEPFAGKLVGARTIRESVAASLDAVDLYVQLPHDTTVTALDGPRASAVTTIQGVSGVGGQFVVNFGIYTDELVRTAAGWQFRHRFLQNIYAEFGALAGHIGIGRAELAAMAREPHARGVLRP